MKDAVTTQRITKRRVMAMAPCELYTSARLSQICPAGVISVQDFCDLRKIRSVPVEDRLWVMLRLLSRSQCREFACDCAERALRRERRRGRPPAVESWRAVEVARQFARGKNDLSDLRRARRAAYDVAINNDPDEFFAHAAGVAWAAALDRDLDASERAGWYAARESDYDHAGEIDYEYGERRWQLRRARHYLLRARASRSTERARELLDLAEARNDTNPLP